MKPYGTRHYKFSFQIIGQFVHGLLLSLLESTVDEKDPRLLQIWNQQLVPVLYRRGKGVPLLVRLPFAKDNRGWLKAEHRNDPEWVKEQKYWQTPKSWFEGIIKNALLRYKSIYVIQPFNPDEKCAPACWHALGAECECSCMGANHGSGEPLGRWHVVSETLAVKWGPKQYSCRLLKPAGGVA